MGKQRYGLSIAGLDPSGGAGILADIKTFEALGVQGFGVATATTYQNEHTFYGQNWLSFEEIVCQLTPLFEAYEIEYVKIGLIENWDTLRKIIALLRDKNAEITIVWDPILEASSGYVFHHESLPGHQVALLKSVDLITPNAEELRKIFSSVYRGNMGKKLSRYCSVLLKGGHGEAEDADDVLFENGNATFISGKRLPYDKHGTGCVLSAAIVAHLAMGSDVEESCRQAKNYINKFLMSNSSLLGSHSLQNEKTYS